jgi:iron-sulfur cluster repair protein YtfE (RIC family)
MSNEGLRAQHTRLRDLATQLSGELRRGDAAARGAEIRALLNRLGGALMVHLAAEDQGFYPRMVADKRPEVAAVAARYQTEMGPLKDRVEQYMRRWTSETIATELVSFARETTRLLGELAKRMQREEQELYPLDTAP